MKRTKQISTLPSFFNTRQAFRDTVKSKRNLSTQSHFNTLSNFSGSSNYKHGMTPSAVSFLSQPFKTNLTEKDSEYLSTIYTNISDYKGISSKYNIPTQLSYDEQSVIKKRLRYPKKDSSIIYTSNPKDEMFTDPYKSKEILNVKNDVYHTILNIRMQTQSDVFYQTINSIMEKKKIISKMPKVRISKVTINSGPVRRASTTKSIESKKTGKGKEETKEQKEGKEKKEKEEDRKPKHFLGLISNNNLFGGMTREQMLNEIRLSMGVITTQYHPFSRDQFSFSITEDEIIYIFGGMQGRKLNDLWCFNLNSKTDNPKWTKLNIKEDDSPIPRYGHSMVYYDNHLYIFGGCVKENYFRGREDSISVFDINYNNFSYPNCTNNKSVPWRRNHIAVGIGFTMLVHGGIDDYGGYLNDIWILDILKLKWMPLIYRAKFRLPSIAFHSSCLVIKSNAIVHHNQLNIYKIPDAGGKVRGNKPKLEGVYIFGGIDKDSNYTNNLWFIRVGTKPVDIINLRTVGKPPSPRMNCGMCYLNELNFVVIHGGKNQLEESNSVLGDVMLLDLENFHWIKPVYKEETFEPVCGHINFSYGNTIFVLGGFNLDGFSKFDFFTIDFDFLKGDFFDPTLL